MTSWRVGIASVSIALATACTDPGSAPADHVQSVAADGATPTGQQGTTPSEASPAPTATPLPPPPGCEEPRPESPLPYNVLGVVEDTENPPPQPPHLSAQPFNQSFVIILSGEDEIEWQRSRVPLTVVDNLEGPGRVGVIEYDCFALDLDAVPGSVALQLRDVRPGRYELTVPVAWSWRATTPPSGEPEGGRFTLRIVLEFAEPTPAEG